VVLFPLSANAAFKLYAGRVRSAICAAGPTSAAISSGSCGQHKSVLYFSFVSVLLCSEVGKAAARVQGAGGQYGLCACSILTFRTSVEVGQGKLLQPHILGTPAVAF